MTAYSCGGHLLDWKIGMLLLMCWVAVIAQQPPQTAPHEKLKDLAFSNNATARATGPQPEGIFRQVAYRRQVLQSDTPAGISAGGDLSNSGTQCSGTGNTCQNTPTTVNNNQQVNVYNFLPPSAAAQPSDSNALRGNQCGASAVNIQGNTYIIYKHADSACGCARVCASSSQCKVWVYCDNEAGCGSGCREYQDNNNYSPPLPCSTTDAWPYQFCTLKTSNLGTANSDYYGWISGTTS